jgi:gas vesicle protein
MSDIDRAVAELVPVDRSGSLLAGLLLGALAGAAAAALVAPRSGAATRELIRERGLVLKDRAGEFVRERRSPL